MPKISKYLVIKDTREQTGWDFPASKSCEGMCVETLPTGDYSLRGYEKSLIIERKRSTAEIATNLFEERFWRELKRLDEFTLPFLVCEFTLADVLSFPRHSGIPRHRWASLRISPQLLLKKINELQVIHRTRILFAGSSGQEFVSSLFKRVVEHVAPDPA